jgi:hypothetical protein
MKVNRIIRKNVAIEENKAQMPGVFAIRDPSEGSMHPLTAREEKIGVN